MMREMTEFIDRGIIVFPNKMRERDASYRVLIVRLYLIAFNLMTSTFVPVFLFSFLDTSCWIAVNEIPGQGRTV
jgi:hypothetical protein